MARRLTFFLLLWSCPSFAYQTNYTTGDVLRSGQYRTGLNTQFITSEFSGATANGHFDLGVREDGEARIVLGVGKVDFHAGALYKWVPFPDLEKQPAVGVMGGPVYGRVNSKGVLTLRAVPFVSETFEVEEAGILTPYGGLPLGLEFVEGSSQVPVQVMAGCDWKPMKLDKVHFNGEVGINLSKSFNYIAVGVAVYFDDSTGFRLE